MKINFHRVILGFFENWDKSPQKKWDNRFFVAFIFVTGSLFAEVRTWTGRGDGFKWSDQNNWENGVPLTMVSIEQSPSL